MDTELSLIRYNLVNFFQILMYSRPLYPTSTLLIKVVEALLSSENEPDEEIRKRIDWIYNNTHKSVMKHLSIVEYAIYRNIGEGLNREIQIGNESFFLIELYKYLNEIEKELTNIVIKIAKKYTFEIPLSNITGMGTVMGTTQGSDVQSITLK